jgi:hypothetical protein
MKIMITLLANIADTNKTAYITNTKYSDFIINFIVFFHNWQYSCNLEILIATFVYTHLLHGTFDFFCFNIGTNHISGTDY